VTFHQLGRPPLRTCGNNEVTRVLVTRLAHASTRGGVNILSGQIQWRGIVRVMPTGHRIGATQALVSARKCVRAARAVPASP
jgi:hypothetical protein